MFTLAHEMGHAMHSHYSSESQDFIYSDYSFFLAEVASTVNEILLMNRLLETAENKPMRDYLLNNFLEQFRTTFFRQTMFAEFEMTSHEMAERGEPLTVDALNGLYRGLNRKYYGDGIVLDECSDIEWARIPHFYTPYYVYQYATGFAAAIAFTERMKACGESAVRDYIGFLESGGSAYSIDILKKAGVDMSTPEAVRNALEVFKKTLEQFSM